MVSSQTFSRSVPIESLVEQVKDAQPLAWKYDTSFTNAIATKPLKNVVVPFRSPPAGHSSFETELVSDSGFPSDCTTLFSNCMISQDYISSTCELVDLHQIKCRDGILLRSRNRGFGPERKVVLFDPTSGFRGHLIRVVDPSKLSCGGFHEFW